MATVLERLELLIESKLNAQGLEAAKSGVGELTSKLAPADNMLAKLGITGQITGSQLGALGAGAAAAGVAGLIALAGEGISKFQSLAANVLHFQQVTGTTADEASRFVAVMDDYKVSADQGALAFSRLGNTIQQAPQKLSDLGIAVARTKDGAVDMQATFFNVVDAYNATEDASRRAAIGTAAFGRGWQDLSNLLSQGSANLRQAFDSVTNGQVLSQKDLQMAEQYRLAMDNLHDAIRDFEMELGKGVIPALTTATTVTTKMIEAIDKLAAKAGGLQGVFKWVTFVIPPLHYLSDAIGAAGSSADAAVPAVDNLGNAMEEAANKAISLRSALDHAIDATSNVEHAQNKLEKAQLALIDAQERYTNGGKTNLELQNEAASAAGSRSDKERQVADALKGVERAQRQVTDAQRSLNDAQEAFDESQRKVIDTTNALRDAQLALLAANTQRPREAADAAKATEDAKRRQAGAELDLADAQDKAKAAQQAVNDAVAAYGAGSPEALKATRDAQRAELDLQQRQRDLEIAQRAVNEATRDQIAVDVQLKSVSGQLEDAQSKLENAQRGVEDAQKSSQQAARTLEDRNRDLADAVEGVADANRRVLEAQNARDGGAPAHQAVTKTTAQLEQDLKDAQLGVRDAQKDVADKTGDANVALQNLSDLLNNTTTPAALLAAQKTAAIRAEIAELTKSLDPNSDAYKYLQGYSALLATIDRQAGNGYQASSSSSPNAAEHGLESVSQPVIVKIGDDTIANVVAKVLRTQTRENG